MAGLVLNTRYFELTTMKETIFDSLPVIGKSLAEIKPSDKYREKCPAGSALAMSIAQNAVQLKKQNKLLTVICADPSDVIRLQDEVTWFVPSLKLTVFPDWETLPYDVLSPHADLVGERLQTLYLLLNRQKRQDPVDVLIVSASTATQRLAPRNYIGSTTFFFRKGDRIDPTDLRAELVARGYEHVSQVVAPGEFASRGGLLDLFPMGAAKPYRLDFFDDELDEIRVFDPDNQRSVEKVDEIRLLPAHEFPMDKQARSAFCSRWRETFEGDPSKVTLYKDIENGIAAPGVENYLPLFFDETETLFDYIGSDASLILLDDVNSAIEHFDKETEQRAKFLRADGERPILDFKRLYLSAPQFFELAGNYARLSLTDKENATPNFPSVAIERRKDDPLEGLKAYKDLCSARGRKLLVMANSAGRLETISDVFKENGLKAPLVPGFEKFLESGDNFALCYGPLYDGMELENPPISILTETELYSNSDRPVRRRRRRTERESNIEMMIRDLSELKVGDPVVHLDHGVGRYRGLTSMSTPDGEAEFLQIDYAKDAKLYVPVAQLHLISRYSGADPETAPLHSLGKGDWEKARKKAALQVRDTAAELLNIYALRQSRKGYAFKFSLADYEAFSEAFAFEETEDQLAAINAVYRDMISDKPMDRLVCGDVGFGKTEVALRAAFMAVMGGKQVAVLCPTTLLAEQHAQTFRDRFANWPVRIAELSRFRSSKEVNASIEGIKNGTIDIVVGTHKLLSDKVQFKDLGLVVIDEEHRFGVRQKEQLKSLRSEVDILTLTATPIPRTLSMSLEGIRDFSVIATAPQKRLAIKTFVQRESDSLIREAVLRELKRGGQVYFLHNEVETIENARMRLEQLLPEARIGVAHGQMNERELERVMRDFYAQRTNVLLCTTIIETGIDIPNANTIIMHRADKFGLAQLHQLRGRVGRSHHQAYAYLLTPGEGAMTKNAEKRLEAIKEMEELGSGFYLAMHDLEIRGAGEVLGEHQSGSMTGVGFDLYTQMLDSAVTALKEGREPDLLQPLEATTDINLHAPALLRSDYVPDVHNRLTFYKRLAQVKNKEDLYQIQEEIADRYGKLTQEAKNLILTHRIRVEAKPLGVLKIDAGEDSIIFTFKDKPSFDPGKFFRMLQANRNMRMLGPNRLRLDTYSDTAEKRGDNILRILKELK